MLKYFLPRSDDFFVLFQASADVLVDVSHQFNGLLNNLHHVSNYAKSMAVLESKARKIKNDTLTQLHKTFITPFDRYDIYSLVKKLHSTVDAINRTSQRVIIYKLTVLPTEIRAMSDLCVRAATIIQGATAQLHSLKNTSKILELCEEVTPLESEAEKLLLSGVSQLFDEESDLRQLLKTKEIYEYTKSAINKCQVVTYIIKDIVLEYS